MLQANGASRFASGQPDRRIGAAERLPAFSSDEDIEKNALAIAQKRAALTTAEEYFSKVEQMVKSHGTDRSRLSRAMVRGAIGEKRLAPQTRRNGHGFGTRWFAAEMRLAIASVSNSVLWAFPPTGADLILVRRRTRYRAI